MTIEISKRDYDHRISTILNLVPTDMSIENPTFKLDDNGKANIAICKLATNK
jgi:hypothetical protein